ncbi:MULTISPECIES: serine hydrolase [unclassified Sphingobacterium]|uniref:serine hydrolase n=1 Tax=unclassified Sphingobacterium TaxID=2609468 RepID=UPI0025FD3EF4|nr:MULTISPECIES: serine hydrolase [unclassified Sphingobacterium]
MKSYFKIILLLFTSTLSQQVFAQSTSDSIDLFIKEKMLKLKIPGLQLAVIRNNSLEKLSAYGLANIEHQISVDSTSSFSINSMTKAHILQLSMWTVNGSMTASFIMPLPLSHSSSELQQV